MGHVEFAHRSWPAAPGQLTRIRRELTDWLAPLALSDDEVAEIVLAVDEAVANAVCHAYDPDETGSVELTLWTEDDALYVEVVDHGRWRPPDEHPTEGGRGIPLMQHMADSVLIHHGTGGSSVLLRHRLHPLPQPRQQAEPHQGAEGSTHAC